MYGIRYIIVLTIKCPSSSEDVEESPSDFCRGDIENTVSFNGFALNSVSFRDKTPGRDNQKSIHEQRSKLNDLEPRWRVRWKGERINILPHRQIDSSPPAATRVRRRPSFPFNLRLVGLQPSEHLQVFIFSDEGLCF